MTMKTNSVGLIPLARRWDRLSPVLCAIVVASTLLAAASLSARGRETAGGIQGSAMEGPLAAHPPISIEGDAGFTPANGVTGGTGTPSDPYIIEGWVINASAAVGIEIDNTSAAFIVRSVSLTAGNGSNPFSVAKFTNVTNGRIENATTGPQATAQMLSFYRVTNLTIAQGHFARPYVTVNDGSNVSVEGNTVTGPSPGLISLKWVDRASVRSNRGFTISGSPVRHAEVDGNDIESSYIGIFLNESRDVRITNNTLRGSPNGVGIDTWFGNQDILIADNKVSGFGWGMGMYADRNVTITANDVEGNQVWGIGTSASNATVTYNTLLGNGVGLWIGGSETFVHHNDFINNSQQVDSARGTNHSWDDGYPSGGNFWSDYTGIDVCRGPLQDDCTGGDGNGDTPRAVNATETDRYPLMQPIAQDTTPPVVTITSPANGTTVEVPTLAVSGTAWDFGGSGVSRVDVRVNSGSWTSANGTSSWTRNVSLVNGTNLVEARAWDGAGNPSGTVQVYVDYNPPPPPPNYPPYVGNVTWTPWTGNTSTVFTFTASVWDDHDPPSAILVRWDWEGDGVWDTPWSVSKTIEHTYPVAGTYTGVLQAIDTGNLTGNGSFTVQVTEPPPPPPPPLTAEISATPESGTMPLTVSFTSHVTGGVSPYQYQWTLGDGSTSPAANTVHIYVTGGNFTAWLIVYDSARGYALSNYLWVNVTSAAVNLTVIPPTDFVTTRAGVNATLQAVVWGGVPPYTFTWDFGDGQVGTGMSPTHTYPGPGTYDVVLTVTDSQGTSASYSMTLTIPQATMPPREDLTGVLVGIALVGGLIGGVAGHALWVRRRGPRKPPSGD